MSDICQSCDVISRNAIGANERRCTIFSAVLYDWLGNVSHDKLKHLIDLTLLQIEPALKFGARKALRRIGNRFKPDSVTVA